MRTNFLQRNAPVKVALYFDRSETFIIEAFKGVTRFLSENPDVGLVSGTNNENWVILDRFEMIEESGADGLLCFVYSEEKMTRLRELSIPFINLSGTELESNETQLISFDDYEMGTNAASYLLDLGFQNFGFCARAPEGFVMQRLQGLQDKLSDRSYSLHTSVFDRQEYYEDKYASWDLFQRDVIKWIPTLPRPISIVVPLDQDARLIYSAAEHLGHNIPNDIAILAMGNELSSCYTLLPTLSSVPQNISLAGFYGMQYLKELILGRGEHLKPMAIQSLPVVARGSTNVEHFDDPTISAALQFIRNNALKGIGFEDVATAVHCSRSTLSRRFKDTLGTGVVEFIRRTQLNHAQELLMKKTYSIDEVAWHSGFSDPRQFQRAFKKLFEMSATEYRKRVVLNR